MAQANNDQDRGQPVRLSFSVNRLQWVVNPPARIFFAVLAVAALVGGPVLLVLAVIDNAPLDVIFVFALVPLLGVLGFRGPAMSFYGALTTDAYFNTLLIERDSFSIGIDGLQLRFPRKGFRVSRGLFGTFIVRNVLGHAVVLPKAAMPYRELKRLIET